MNSKDWKNTYCIKCVNRSYNLEEGIICSLTNQIPKIEENCPEYVIDKNQEIQLIENAKNEILSKSQYSSTTEEFIRLAKNYDPLKFQYFNSKLTFGGLAILGLTFIIFLNLSVFVFTPENILESFSGIFIYAFLSLLGLGFIAIGIAKSRDKSIQLEFNSEGVKTKTKTIEWQKILFSAYGAGIEKKIDHCLFIYCSPIEKYEIELDSLDGTIEQIVFSFEHMKRNITKQRSSSFERSGNVEG